MLIFSWPTLQLAWSTTEDLPEEHSDIQDLHKVIQCLCKIERHLETMFHMSNYVTKAAIMVTNISARVLRTGLQ